MRQRRLARERLLHERVYHGAIEIEQRGQRSHIGHVLHEDAGSRLREMLVAHARERDTDDVDVAACKKPVARPRGIVDEHSARADFG